MSDQVVPGNHVASSAQGHSPGVLARVLRTASYEVLAFPSTEEKVLAAVPRDVGLTISTTTGRGLEPTLDLAARLRHHGYRVAPHLVARLVRDESHLAEITARLHEADVDAVFVVGGDAAEPVGPFNDALSLLLAMGSEQFTTIGIAGYPEGHALVDEGRIREALTEKATYATEITTQMCFDSEATLRWARAIHRAGVTTPIRVGIPGAVRRQKLIRISATLGLGQSARFLAKQQNLLWRFFLPGGYRPDRLVEDLTPAFGRLGSSLSGLQVFTFNELAPTEAWRQRWLTRLGAA